MIGSTGPKISSRMIRMSCVTPVSTVGAMKWPLKPGHLDRPAAEPLGACGDRVVDELVDEVELLLRDHRPDLGVPVGAGRRRVSALASRTTPSMKRSATSRTT